MSPSLTPSSASSTSHSSFLAGPLFLLAYTPEPLLDVLFPIYPGPLLDFLCLRVPSPSSTARVLARHLYPSPVLLFRINIVYQCNGLLPQRYPKTSFLAILCDTRCSPITSSSPVFPSLEVETPPACLSMTTARFRTHRRLQRRKKQPRSLRPTSGFHYHYPLHYTHPRIRSDSSPCTTEIPRDSRLANTLAYPWAFHESNACLYQSGFTPTVVPIESSPIHTRFDSPSFSSQPGRPPRTLPCFVIRSVALRFLFSSSNHLVSLFLLCFACTHIRHSIHAPCGP
ncbi:hypothetical protein FB45DRAFT_1027482 [Roridomyces roridus]|uniref:Uncharacterized protein n=1 Tax=Roridomyces roridus TaxID=1738132 RepID=A0AAD7FKY6_9AGAR|nr:hypothetical protein FB45DRAFT_1027482 [Roridomyces roridus]